MNSAAHRVERPGLRKALSHLRETDTLVVWKLDTLVVWKLDRLGRSEKGLVDLVNELEARKAHFQPANRRRIRPFFENLKK